MSVFDRAGNLLKGLLRKPLRALERTPEERLLERELEDKAALERARANIDAMDRRAEASGSAPAKKDAPAPETVKTDDGRKKRRMGPDD